MSWNTEDEARKVGEKVLKMMKTGKWEIEVWSNLGWHVSLNRKFMSLGIHKYGGEDKLAYTVLVARDSEYPGTGETYWADPIGSYGNPNNAVEGAIIAVRDFVEKANVCLKEITSN